jgi:hypothetical protein
MVHLTAAKGVLGTLRKTKTRAAAAAAAAVVAAELAGVRHQPGHGSDDSQQRLLLAEDAKLLSALYCALLGSCCSWHGQ